MYMVIFSIYTRDVQPEIFFNNLFNGSKLLKRISGCTKIFEENIRAYENGVCTKIESLPYSVCSQKIFLRKLTVVGLAKDRLSLATFDKLMSDLKNVKL